MLIFVTAFVIFLMVIEKFLIKKFDIKKKKGLYKHVNKVHIWLEIVLAIALITIAFFISEFKSYYLPIFLIALYSFRAFIEWKFEKESKVYILSMLSASAFLLLLIIFKLLF